MITAQVVLIRPLSKNGCMLVSVRPLPPIKPSGTIGFWRKRLSWYRPPDVPPTKRISLLTTLHGRPIGGLEEEVGGVMNTLAALCSAYGIDMQEAGDIELARCWANIEKIRAKQAAKKIRSPLPGYIPPELSE